MKKEKEKVIQIMRVENEIYYLTNFGRIIVWMASGKYISSGNQNIPVYEYVNITLDLSKIK